MLQLILQSLSRFFCSLSLHRALAVGRALGWIYGTVIRYHRRDALDALRRSLPEKTEAERVQILRSMYRNIGMNLAEEFRMPQVNDEYLNEYISWEGDQYSREVLTAGKGLIVLAAHFGNWDILCTIAPHFVHPTTIITKAIKNKSVNAFWMKSRERFGLKFVPAHNSYRQCLSALRHNEIVGFVLDQNMIRTEGIFVDFFGKPACTSPGLAFMAAQSKAAVVPVFIIRLPHGKHLVKALPPIPPPPDRKPDTILTYTQLYTKTIEDMIRQYPDQWIWIHRRWRTTPENPADTIRDAQQSA
jgi:KDO2-lipid IV(A) lauroyltransferase